MKHSQYLNLKLPLLNEKTITLFKKLSNSLSDSNSTNLQKGEYFITIIYLKILCMF